jgi:hypothetical protein
MPADELRRYILTWAGKKKVQDMEVETGVALATIVKYATHMQVSLAMSEAEARRIRVDVAITEGGKDIGQLVKELDVSYLFYRAARLGIRLKSKAHHRGKVPTVSRMFFNPHAHENWII